MKVTLISLLLLSFKLLAEEIPPYIYYFGHVHSNISKDNEWATKNKKTPVELYRLTEGFLEKRKRKGLLSITDHNSIESFQVLAENINLEADHILKVIKGMEFGGKTHISLIGLASDKFHYKGPRVDTAQLVSASWQFKPKLVVINHPRIFYGSWKKEDWGDTHAVEVWNQPYDHRPMQFYYPGVRNLKALEDWAKHLHQGKRYTAIAASDFHFEIPCYLEHLLFYPTSLVLGPDNEPNSVLERIKRGKVSLALSPQSPLLFIQGTFIQEEGEVTHLGIGDEARGLGSIKLQVIIDSSEINRIAHENRCYRNRLKLKEIQELSYFDQYELRIYQSSLRPSKKKSYPVKPMISKYHWNLDVNNLNPQYARAEVWLVNKLTKRERILALTNPLLINYSH